MNYDWDKDENYIRRRNWLLSQMKKTKWEIEEEKSYCKRGRKPTPKPKAMIDMDKARNKRYSWSR